MTSQMHEYNTFTAAQERHNDLKRLGWRPFSIFQTSRGTWAFWVG